MKRLALVLAAAVLGTGCNHDDCDPTVTLQWDFRTADGAVVGCSTVDADIRFVDVFVDDLPAASFDCGAGSGSIRLARGSSLFTVEGVDVTGRIIYRDEFVVDAGRCGNQLVATRPAEGRVNLDYGTTLQTVPANTFVWFSVFDNIAGQVATELAEDVPLFNDYPRDLVFRLPAGSYTVDFMELRSGGAPVRRACTAPTFTVTAGSAPGFAQLVPATPVPLDCL
jgi:hypothetical protein